ncbi:hypothetical protein PHYBOEH_003849 [Phytophthora boehmeriae]|uniref:Peptidase S33 tripeptidyl aminopeptidase-like C-terminal domain-containing protein n=1 Tax=Phytophthora boehmeriae TaxID=109152 RepID=A0A8T1X9F8_9STRA|nr:hypothetical protein PHYBOEH_003849 [Phytophthora boehmeriae]
MDSAIANAFNITVQCTKVELPLCYEGICNAENDTATIAVSLKRIPALIADSTSGKVQAIWYLPDRPDVQTREEVDLEMALLYQELMNTVDIYTLDLRGTGNSTALSCNASDGSLLQANVFARNNGDINLRDVQACAQHLQDLGYTNLRAFSLASAARDIEKVVADTQTDLQVIIYALGYGTLVAQQLMQREASQIVGCVLDGALGMPAGDTGSASLSLSEVEAAAYELSKSAKDFGEVANGFIAWCQADTSCSTMFSGATPTTMINTTLFEVYDRLDGDATSMCAAILSDVDASGSINSATASVTPPSFVLRQLMAQMMESSTLRAFIPVLTYRFHRCGSEDLVVLSNFVNTTLKTLHGSDTPDLLYAIQAFSELWERPTANQTELTNRFTDSAISDGREYTQLLSYCLFTGDSSPACVNATTFEHASTATSRNGATLSYEHDAIDVTTNVIPSGASILLLSSGLDPISPPKYAAALFDSLQGVNKAHLVAPNGTHGVVQSAMLSNGTGCGRQVLASYVRHSGNLSAYDATCMDEVLPPSLAITNISTLLVLGVSDAYDGVLDIGSESDGSIGASGSSNSPAGSPSSGSSIDDLNKQISALESSRRRYKMALIIVGSALAALLVGGVVLLFWRHHRKKQLEYEEVLLRHMRGDADNELELMHSIYLLSSSPSSNGERGRDASRQ